MQNNEDQEEGVHLTPTYVLMLNDMRDAHSEHLVPVACFKSLDEIFQFLKAQHVGSYSDGVDGECGHYGGGVAWNKVYRAGGPLEWFNPPTLPDGDDCPPLWEWNRYQQCVIEVTD